LTNCAKGRADFGYDPHYSANRQTGKSSQDLIEDVYYGEEKDRHEYFRECALDREKAGM
jgi:hypothetical protein